MNFPFHAEASCPELILKGPMKGTFSAINNRWKTAHPKNSCQPCQNISPPAKSTRNLSDLTDRNEKLAV